MIEFLSVFHILITIALCGLVLIQDSKGGGALGIGGSGSNSLLGATGAQSLAANMTKWVAFLFAASCISLTYFLAHQNKSVVDQLGAAAISAPAANPASPSAGAPDTKPVSADAQPATATSAPAQQPAAAAPSTPEKK